MITTTIVNGCISIASLIVELLPVFTPRIPTSILTLVTSVFNGIGYFIPISTVTTIISIILAFQLFKFTYNMIAELRDWTPLVW